MSELPRTVSPELSSQTYSPVTDAEARQIASWLDCTEPSGTFEEDLRADIRILLAERKHLLGLLEPFGFAAQNVDSAGYEYAQDVALTVSEDYELDLTMADIRAAAQAIKERGQEV